MLTATSFISGARQFYIAPDHESGVSDYNEIIKAESSLEVIDDGNHRVTLILRAVEDVVCQRISVLAHKQSQNNLRFRGLATMLVDHYDACRA